MAQQKPVSTVEISEIQREMAQIRREMHEGVRDAVRGAQSLADWRSMVKNRPWLAMGVAAAAGYLIVPARRRTAPTAVPSSGVEPPYAPAFASMSSAHPLAERLTPGRALGTVLGLLLPVVVRAAQNHAAGHLENWLANRFLSPGPREEADSTKSGERAAERGSGGFYDRLRDR